MFQNQNIIVHILYDIQLVRTISIVKQREFFNQHGNLNNLPSTCFPFNANISKSLYASVEVEKG